LHNVCFAPDSDRAGDVLCSAAPVAHHLAMIWRCRPRVGL
jgi:hypothetical protein